MNIANPLPHFGWSKVKYYMGMGIVLMTLQYREGAYMQNVKFETR